ncbi:hypothetical protein CVT25_005648 [Psilocybe cyanescens]|uniref:Uncharacterized protein n=1 Tax=Psilocybe cyanescens TaxID=93625 RepID=A0A409VLD1_PSICY|nr:hypothetical protein CVT25_005648 [Psilocybe cyanescens]
MNMDGHHAMNGYRSNNVASTSSDTYSDFVPQRPGQPLFPANHHQQHLSQPMQRHVPQNQWQDLAMQMNNQQITGNPVSLQHQHQFNAGPWANQMPPSQTFPNAMPMGTFNMPYLPPHILQEAFAMSAPVEPADEPTLLTKLLSSARRQESYKDALNSLHGKNGHSASLWKDYYLDNRIRLDAWISMCLQKEKEASSSTTKRSAPSEHLKASLPTAKKPSPATFKREPSPQNSFSRVSISAPSGKRPQKKSSQSTPPIITKDQPQPGRRSTINSLTAPSPVFGGRLPAPNADIKIPDPPSRSPSPPTNVIPHRGRGNKYTNEDREFFIEFVGWRLKKDPSLTRHEICELLAQKAPHHTAQSWASHWSNNHDVPDKILAAARGEEYDSGDSSSSEEEDATPRRRPKYKDITTSEESGDEESDAGDQNEEPEDDSDDSDETPIRHYSDKEMGERGAPFNDADLYVTAKYIAAFSNWDNANSKDRWEPYHEKYPQRSAKSWAEYYRKNERPLRKLVKRFRNEGTKVTVLSIQCARPTRTPPKAKRKFNYDSNEDSFVKRGRAE